MSVGGVDSRAQIQQSLLPGCLRECHTSDLLGFSTFLLVGKHSTQVVLKQPSHSSPDGVGSSPLQAQHTSSESHRPGSLTSRHAKGSHIYCLHFPSTNILSSSGLLHPALSPRDCWPSRRLRNDKSVEPVIQFQPGLGEAAQHRAITRTPTLNYG